MLTPSIRRFAIIVITLAVLGTGIATPAGAGPTSNLPERATRLPTWSQVLIELADWIFGVEIELPAGAHTKGGASWIPDGLDLRAAPGDAQDASQPAANKIRYHEQLILN